MKTNITTPPPPLSNRGYPSATPPKFLLSLVRLYTGYTKQYCTCTSNEPLRYADPILSPRLSCQTYAYFKVYHCFSLLLGITWTTDKPYVVRFQH